MDDGVLLLLGAGALWLSAKARTGKKLQFLPTGVDISGGGLAVAVGVQNPTNTSLTLNSFAGQVYINGVASGNVSDFTARIIQPNAQTEVVLNLVPSLFGGIQDILNLVTGSGPDGLALALKGTANVNGIPVPVNLTFQAISA